MPLTQHAYAHLADPFYGDANPVGRHCRIVKNGVGDYTVFLQTPLKHIDDALIIPSFNEDVGAAANLNIFVEHVSDLEKRIRIRQGATGTLVDLHVDIAFLRRDEVD